MRILIISLLLFILSIGVVYGQNATVLFKTINLESPYHKKLSKVFKQHFVYPRVPTYARIKIKSRFDPYKIWQAAGENKKLFIDLVNDKRVNLDFRLVAYWVLHRMFNKEAVGFFDRKILASLFYDAFWAENYYEHWSFPRESHPPFELKTFGELLEMLVELGDISIPLWYKSLDNNEIMRSNCLDGMYLRCATYNSNISFFEYRRNDYVAFYLSQITKIPLPFHEKYSERVKEIELFKTKIRIYCALNSISLK